MANGDATLTEKLFFRRISNRIGGSPDQLLMKCVRVGRPAIFKS